MPSKIPLPKITFRLVRENIMRQSFKNVQFTTSRVINVLLIPPPHNYCPAKSLSKASIEVLFSSSKRTTHIPLPQCLDSLPKHPTALIKLQSIPVPQPLGSLCASEKHLFPMHILGPLLLILTHSDICLLLGQVKHSSSFRYWAQYLSCILWDTSVSHLSAP